MDPSRIRDLKFRMQTLNSRLAVGKLLHSYNSNLSNQCPYCNQIEDIPHLWSCQTTINKYPQISDETMLIFHNRYPKLPLNIINILNINNPNFLNLHLSCGIVTDNDILTLEELLKKYPQYKHHSTKKLLSSAIDCFLSAFYNLIWKPRCEFYYNPEKERTFPLTHLQRQIQLLNLLNEPLFPPIEIDPDNIDVFHLFNDPLFPPVIITEENYHLFAPPMN